MLEHSRKTFKNTLYVDSGCSMHMTGDSSLLQNLRPHYEKGGNITRTGIVSNGKMEFEDVCFVEQLQFNLLSVS